MLWCPSERKRLDWQKIGDSADVRRRPGSAAEQAEMKDREAAD